MNTQIVKLLSAASKKTRLIIGLMSGTSLDGLDVALCLIAYADEGTKVKVLAFETHEYEEAFKNQIKEIFAKEEGSFKQLTLLNAKIGRLHGELVLKSLKKWNITPEEVDAIASHGQTVFHHPKRSIEESSPFRGLGGTLQIGDADHIAHTTGILTISDFRQKHIAAGGEGAPLAIYGDCLLFSSEEENRILLNIGGIANFTFLPKLTGEKEEVMSKMLVTDTGPGNTLIDAAMQKYFNQPYDENGEVAAEGKVIPELLEALKTNPFFKEKAPKSTGQEQFNLEYVTALSRSLSEAEGNKHENRSSLLFPSTSLRERVVGFAHPADIVTTLTHLTAQTIAGQIKNLNTEAAVYVSGGGAHNSTLMNLLKELLPNFEFKKIDVLGISADAKEAVLFAVLANQTLAGSPIKIADLPAVNFGKISFPK